MLSLRLNVKKILFVIMSLSIPGGIYSQVISPDTVYYDTTDYISDLYKGSLDYNLMIAASKGYTREISRLIMEGADVSAETYEGATPLIFAVSNNHTEVAKLLIDYGSDVNQTTSRKVNPLIIAVKNQNSEIAEALIRADADIDFTDKYDATALHYASAYGYFQIADMLLYYEASIDKKTIEGSTPLLASIWAGNADIADLLIQNGANTEAKDNEGFTPFMMAALNGDTVIMQLLLKKGIDIYATNKWNRNALDIAIIADQRDAVAFLLKIGDKWVNKGSKAINPYSEASKYQRKDIIKILEENEAPGNLNYEIDQVDIMASTRFSLHDLYTGASFSFREPYLNGGIIVGCDFKLWYTRVLQQQSEHLFYQYMDKGSVVYAGLFKDFALTNYSFKGNFEISTSVSAGYAFGDQLKGTLYTSPDKFIIIPALAVNWTKRNLSFSLGANYMNSAFYHIGPVW